MHNYRMRETYMNIENKISELINKMSLEEKSSLLGGEKGFYLKGIKRLNLPSVKMTDGPMGIVENGKATAFPANIFGYSKFMLFYNTFFSFIFSRLMSSSTVRAEFQNISKTYNRVFAISGCSIVR
jgi:hypothetical protein